METARVDVVCDAAFAGIRAAFAENLEQRGEVGAAVCVHVNGRLVAELWGGMADPARGVEWSRDTLVNAYFTGKGVLAMLALDAVERGLCRLDAPIASVWPEFAAEGKSQTTLRMLLAHQAGLPSVRKRLTPEAMYDWNGMCEALAGQAPWWSPGGAHGYHVGTYGFLVGEVLRRATGRPIGALLQERLIGGLGVEPLRAGLPARTARPTPRPPSRGRRPLRLRRLAGLRRSRRPGGLRLRHEPARRSLADAAHPGPGRRRLRDALIRARL